MQLLPHGLYWKRVKSKQTNKQTNTQQTNKQNRTKQTKQTNKQTKQNKTNNIKQLWVRIGYPDT